MLEEYQAEGESFISMDRWGKITGAFLPMLKLAL